MMAAREGGLLFSFPKIWFFRKSGVSLHPRVCLLLYNILKYYGTDNVYTRLLRHYSGSTDAFPS